MMLFFKFIRKVSTISDRMLLFTGILFGVVTIMQAQDIPRGAVTGSGLNTTIPNNGTQILSPLNRYSTPKKAPLIGLSPEPEKSLLITPQYANRGKELEKKLNKRDGKVEERYKSDQYLGDFKSNSKFVTVVCRDHQHVDGDRVKVYVNDMVVQPDILLDSNFFGFDIPLRKGFNKIDFQALNQGSSGPNTAEFKVYDDKGTVISANLWNLATGVKATLIIVKE